MIAFVAALVINQYDKEKDGNKNKIKYHRFLAKIKNRKRSR